MNKTGFGFLRLPQTADGGIDYALLNPLVDQFLALGGRYFDTAYTYLKGLSEEAIRKSLVERHPREAFLLADKLPGYKITAPEECQVYFQEQLRRCGVEYFDVYLLHWLNERNYEIAVNMQEFSFLRQLKAQGKARKIGFSYHDGPELLDRILTQQPDLDYVQLQINYLDWDSPSIQARKCYEVALSHGVAVLVMEPVKGGTLATLPPEAQKLLPGSPAIWALRFASSLPQVEVVLSGMNAMDQIRENLQPMAPLTEDHRQRLARAARILRSKTAVACTACSYCVGSCPQRIPIPQYFALYNDYARNPSEDWKMQHAYHTLVKTRKSPSHCISCHACEKMCPQNLPIPQYLQDVKAAFEK